MNTEVCEQLFNKVNSHSNCKSMNGSKYFLFWLYNLDLHNLDREDLVAASDPRTQFRWLKITIREVDLDEITKKNIEVIEKVESISLEEQHLHVCDECGGGFSSEGYLENHKEKKHGDIVKPFMCIECNKILKSKRNLEDHMQKLHRSCKQWNTKFENRADLELQRREHMTCTICEANMKTKFKLERHTQGCYCVNILK